MNVHVRSNKTCTKGWQCKFKPLLKDGKAKSKSLPKDSKAKSKPLPMNGKAYNSQKANQCPKGINL